MPNIPDIFYWVSSRCWVQAYVCRVPPHHHHQHGPQRPTAETTHQNRPNRLTPKLGRNDPGRNDPAETTHGRNDPDSCERPTWSDHEWWLMDNKNVNKQVREAVIGLIALIFASKTINIFANYFIKNLNPFIKNQLSIIRTGEEPVTKILCY